MSHELRTPLNVVIGFSDVLEERYFGELNEKQDQYIRCIQESGRHLLSLINNILDLTSIERPAEWNWILEKINFIIFWKTVFS